MKKIILICMAFVTLVSAAKIKVEEHKYFTKGFRILVNAHIKDTTGIYEARVYFKHSMVQDYQLYAAMECLGNKCHTELPLTEVGLRELNYIVVYQNSAGNVYKSFEYTMQKRDMLELPSWQTLNTKDMQLYTEYAKPMQSIRGFKDRTYVKKSTGDVLGVSVGLYKMKQINPKADIDCSLCVAPKNTEITLDLGK